MRYMSGNQASAFRAVIVSRYPEWVSPDGIRNEEWESTAHYGPYATHGAAKAMVTRAEREQRNRKQRYHWQRPVEITGHVERSPIAWEVAE